MQAWRGRRVFSLPPACACIRQLVTLIPGTVKGNMHYEKGGLRFFQGHSNENVALSHS